MKKRVLAILCAVSLFGASAAGCSKPNDSSSSASLSKTTSAQSTDASGDTQNTSDSSGKETDDTIGSTDDTNPIVTTGNRPDKTNPVTTTSTRAPVTTTSATAGNPWAGSGSVYPSNGSMTNSLTPTFQWKKSSTAQSYTVRLEEKSGNTYKNVFSKTGLTTTSYKHSSSLKAGTIYRYSVYSVSGGKETIMNDFPIVFLSRVDSANHPANKGLDFTVNKKVSEKALKNYLSRSTILSIFWDGESMWDSHVRFLLNTGTKYVGRAGGGWVPSSGEEAQVRSAKAKIDEVHAIDPDIVFEFCIFESISKAETESITVPAWVFEAFGEKVENRKFNYEAMLFPDGSFANHWGANHSVPDITQKETQRFFYYRAVLAINNGFEGIHWGQVELMGQNDTHNRCWTELFTKVRSYASKNARRGFVFFNAHTHGMYASDGKLLFDFHSYPTRNLAPDTEPAHAPSEGNPQKTILQIGSANAIYTKSLGGTTYSGWQCDHLPYFVELDNWSGYNKDNPDRVNKPGDAYWPWGYDEISWFANQPLSYQKEWLSYAYKWVRSNDAAGFFEMPGMRTAWFAAEKTQKNFYAHDTVFDSFGGGLEETIRSIWIANR